jgi:hypothetical protein
MQRMRHGGTARFGSALALLALLALTLLAPVHLVHALERGTLAASLHADCDDQDGHQHHGKHDKHKPVYCPACALGKVAASLLAPTTPVPLHAPALTPVRFVVPDAGVAARPQDLLPQARAPPVAI